MYFAKLGKTVQLRQRRVSVYVCILLFMNLTHLVYINTH